MKRHVVVVSIALVLVISIAGRVCGDDDAAQRLKVFLLAGQSNMEGQGVVDLDHPKYYNAGRGILNNVAKRPGFAKKYPYLKNREGEWSVRDDVVVRFQTKDKLKRGGLSIGFTGYGEKHHIGPEFQFGHLLGEHLDDPILLVKTAWGGKSLYQDFRPPSAGGQVGPYYQQMLQEFAEALEHLGKDFPQYQSHDYELSGFVWFQGWNDMGNEVAVKEYEENLVHLIKDVRSHLQRPNLPVVVGELGNGGPEGSQSMLAIRAAQKAATLRPEFAGTVTFVETTDFARPAEASPNVTHGHHWFGNAESYFLIGDAMGRTMLRLLTK